MKIVSIQASRWVTRPLAWDPTCSLLCPSFPIKNKQNLKVLKSIWQYNLFLENYPAFKGLNPLYPGKQNGRLKKFRLHLMADNVKFYIYFWKLFMMGANRFGQDQGSHTVNSRYLELGYLEFCETPSVYLNQKYILITFSNHNLVSETFLQVQITRSAN